MAARRAPRVRCGIVANVALVLALQVAACETGGGPPGGSLSDAGSGGAGGGASGGSSGSTISCNPTAGGCLCIANDTQPSTIDRCSPTSVAQNDMERGVCCTAQSLCTCIRYICRSDPGSSFCQCGSVPSLASVTLGSPVAECPTPIGTQKCCFSQDNASCICSGLACGAGETEVTNCSAAAAGACSSGEEIAACR
jgi:hypothetical protein